MNILEEMGLADSLVDSGTRVSEFCFRDPSGKVPVRFQAGKVQKYRQSSGEIENRVWGIRTCPLTARRKDQ